MEIQQGQKVTVIADPELMGFKAKEAFTILTGTFVCEKGGQFMIKVEFIPTEIVKETIIVVDRLKVFTNMKDAIDAAYTTYTTAVNKPIKVEESNTN